MKNVSLTNRIKIPRSGIIMRLFCSTVVMLIVTLTGYAIPQDQNLAVSISQKNVPIKTILSELEKQTKFTFFYNTQQVNVQKKVTVNATNKQFSELLTELLSGEGLQYKMVGKQIVLYPKGASADEAIASIQKQDAGAITSNQQDQRVVAGGDTGKSAKITIKGTVTSARDGAPLEFVSVVVKGSKDYTVTDKDGSYSLSTSKANPVLEFAFIGYISTEEPVSGRGIINMQLAEETNMLDVVVVTGYQSISKERVTGSFSTVSSNVINSQISLSLAAGLEGRVAGVVKNKDGDFTIRGVSTMNAVKSPLYVIDGFPVEGDSPQFTSAGGVGTYLTYAPPTINPEDIETVTILKDAAAASIYGSRAANGVIVITTKKAKEGAAQVFFSADMTIKPVPNYDKINYLSANEFIDFEYDYLKGHPRLNNPATMQATINSLRNNNRYAISPTMELMFQAYEGKLTQAEADRMINTYRSDGSPSIVKDFMDHIYRPIVNQRYYMSLGKAVGNNNFLGSITYNDRKGNVRNYESSDLEFSLRNLLAVTRWLDVELNANILSSKDKKHIFQPLGSDGGSVGSALFDMPWPYARIVDNEGNPIKTPSFYAPSITRNLALYPKDLENLDIILQDEQNRNLQNSSTLRTRTAARLNFKLTDWLKFQTGIQYEASYTDVSTLYNKESIGERITYDDFSYLSQGKVIHRLPYGDSFESSHSKYVNFTQRNQLTFNHSLDNGKHVITAIAGTETRQIKGKRDRSRVWGYSSELLTHTSLNYKDLESPKAGLLGRGSKGKSASSIFSQMENINRFVSLYGNVAYTFDSKYDLSASIRWDLSNMFGTNPSYQYRPFWSVGAGWNISQEQFMSSVRWVDRLKLRATYGINGNIAKTVSPYLIASYGRNFFVTRDIYGMVSNPPNENLRWERTQSMNLGVDFSLLKNRLAGSIDAYNKYSDDLLSPTGIDPSYGFNTMTLNVGAVINRGVELDLNGIIVQKNGVQWMAGFTFAYNYNKVDKLYVEPKRANELYYFGNMVQGRPISSMYSYRFVKIDSNGDPVILNEKGEEVANIDVDNIDAVEFSGSTVPLYTGSIYSTVSYKGIELSVNFIYNAGHVMRKQITGPHIHIPNGLMRGDYSNAWQKSGDEQKSGIMPRITYGYDSNAGYRSDHWRYNNSNVVSASYIKLRSITLSYNLCNVVKNKFLKNFTVRGQIDNLFYFAANGEGSDPEAYSLNYGQRGVPMKPTYYLGLNLSF